MRYVGKSIERRGGGIDLGAGGGGGGRGGRRVAGGGGHKEEGREGEKEVMEEECRGGVICGYGCCPFCRSVRVLIL